MVRRFLLILLPALTSTVAFADPDAWNCVQSKESKEWVCADDKKSENRTNKPTGEATAPAEAQSPENATVAEPAPQPLAPGSKESTGASAPKTMEGIVTEQEKTPATAKPKADKLAEPAIASTKKEEPKPVKSASASKKRNGWNCNSKSKDDNWNCVLIGADPKAQEEFAEAETGSSSSLLDPAFSSLDEQVFQTLTSNLKVNPWQSCNAPPANQRNFAGNKDLRDQSPLDVTSDYAETYDNEIGNYSGNVEVTRADQHSVSNTANYDSVSQTLDLQGDVYYSDEDVALHSNSATLKLASNQAKLRNAHFIAPTAPIRGIAKGVYQDSKTLSHYKDVAYTSCAPGNQDWVLHATDLKINKTTGTGATKNAWLEFKGLPVFYSPYLSFPTDNRRVSGFLAPVFGRTQNGGFNFSTPYYWNIAPNYDATLQPRYLTKRGALLGGEFRYLTEHTSGKASAEFLPYDSVADKSRYLLSAKNSTQYIPKLTSNFDLNYVSDKNYFAEIGNALSFPNFSYVKSSADLNYVEEDLALVGRVENYQVIDNTLQGSRRPYRRLPQIAFNWDHNFDSVPVKTALDSEYVYFQHNSLPYGQRFNVKPSVSFPLHNSSAYITPKASLQQTNYFLTRPEAGTYLIDPLTGNPLLDPNAGTPILHPDSYKPDSISRTLPILSVDSGVHFERDFNLTGNSLVQTLEPRLFYLYIPKASQNDIPLFDSSLYDFWYSNMFRENRFSGTDRIQDANQVTAAVSSRILDPRTGKERLKLSLGEIFYFRNREVTAPVLINQYCTPAGCFQNRYFESPQETSSLSPLVGELSGAFNDHFSFESGLQWDPDSNHFVRGKSVLHFVNKPGEIFNIGYLYRKSTLIEDTLAANNIPSTIRTNPANPASALILNPLIDSNDIRQFDTSVRWPIYDNWYGIGHWQYSLLYNKTQEGFIGVEKENCCWRFRLIGRRYVNNVGVNNTSNPLLSTEATSQTGVFFQVELKGLTGIGEKLDQFFEESIYGYGKTQK